MKEGAKAGLTQAAIPYGAALTRDAARGTYAFLRAGTNLSKNTLEQFLTKPENYVKATVGGAKRFLSLKTANGPIEQAAEEYADFAAKHGVTGLRDTLKEHGAVKTAEASGKLVDLYKNALETTRRIKAGLPPVKLIDDIEVPMSPQEINQTLLSGIQAGHRLKINKVIDPNAIPMLGDINLGRINELKTVAEQTMPGIKKVMSKYGEAIGQESALNWFPRLSVGGNLGDIAKIPTTGYFGAVGLGGAAGLAGAGNPLVGALIAGSAAAPFVSPRVQTGVLAAIGASTKIAEKSAPAAQGLRGLLEAAMGDE